MYASLTKKRSTYGIGQARVLVVTEHRIYMFENLKMSRKHKITHLSALIKSSLSPEFVLVFPDLKNLHLDGCSNILQLQTILQMRYANLNPKDTLKIYEVHEKSLALYRPKNKYGFSNYPHHDSRLVKDEIKGADDLKAEEEEKKLQEEIKRLEQKEMEAMDFDPNQGDRFSIL